jgi:hypothetical protein
MEVFVQVGHANHLTNETLIEHHLIFGWYGGTAV